MIKSPIIPLQYGDVLFDKTLDGPEGPNTADQGARTCWSKVPGVSNPQLSPFVKDCSDRLDLLLLPSPPLEAQRQPLPQDTFQSKPLDQRGNDAHSPIGRLFHIPWPSTSPIRNEPRILEAAKTRG